MRRLHLLCLLLVLSLTRSARADSPLLAVEAPSQAAGDGSTVLSIAIRASADAKGAALSQVRLLTNAGTVGPARLEGTATVFPFTPPRLADDGEAVLEATALVGSRRARRVVKIKIARATFSKVPHLSDGPLGLRVPDALLLGQDRRATIEARATSSLQWFVSSGSVQEQTTEGNVHRAVFAPPAAVTPQAAIVAVVEPHTGHFDWLPILLHGQGRMRIKTGPLAVVSLDVDGVTYGPLQADGTGHVRIPVAAPPGVEKAQSEARDQAGNVRRGAIVMGAPPFNRLLALCPGARGKAVFLVVDPRGKPAQSAQIRASISVGSLAPVARVRPGVFEAEARVPLDHDGAVEVRAELAGEPASKATCRANQVSELPSGATIDFQPRSFVAGSPNPVQITVKLAYPGRLPPRKITPSLSASFGSLSAVRETTPGTFVSTWSLPSRFDGKKEARVTVTGASATHLQRDATLSLVPGPAHTLVLASAKSRLYADGRSRTVLTVKATDAEGNATSRWRPSARAEGQVGVFEPLADGSFRATYTAPHVGSKGVDTIVVRDEGGAAEATQEIALLAPRSPWSASLQAGYMTNRAKVAGPMLESTLLWRPPVLDRSLGVGLDASLFTSKHDSDSDLGEPVTTEVRSVPLLSRATFSLPVPPINLFLGARLGANLAEITTTSNTIGTSVVSSTGLAYGALLGGGLPAGPGSLLVEAGYLHTALDDARIKGNLTGMHVTGGYALDF